jgi:hypothetical protein
MRVVGLISFAFMCAADPTRFLVQNGKVGPAGSLIEDAKMDAKQRFERAMQKLKGDRDRMILHEHEFADQAKKLRLRAESPFPQI